MIEKAASTPVARLRRSSTLLMLLAVLSWGILPVVFVVAGAESPSDSLAFVTVLNLVGSATAFMLYLFVKRTSNQANIRSLMSFAKSHPSRLAMLLGDGSLIAVSNALFVWALSRNEDVLVTLVVESWPLLAAFLLTRHIARFQRLGKSQVLVALVAVVGLYLLVSSEQGPGFRQLDGFALLAATLAGLTQAGTVVIHQRLLGDFEPKSDAIKKNFLLQTTRMLVAAVVSILLLVLVALSGGDRQFKGIDSGSILEQAALAGLGGALIVLSALFYARSLQLTDRPLKTLLWFLTPLVSVALLALVTSSTLSTRMLLGATLIVTANILLDKKSEPSWTLSSLVLSATIFGLLVLSVNGQSEPRYFEHLQVLAAFYAIMQGFLLNRLWDRRRQIAAREREQFIIDGLPTQEREERLARASLLEVAAYKDMQMQTQSLRNEISNFSEVLLLTLLGGATALIAIVGRPDSLLGSLNAYLIPVTIVYLLSLTWALALDRLRIEKLNTESERVDAVLNYGAAVVVFASFLVAITLASSA